jgi:23S rRNA pseudouridine1911/1915/1917 synthase
VPLERANGVEERAIICEGSQVPAVELEIEGEEAGERLDVFLARRIPELSRARAKVLIETGEVRVDGRRVKKSYALAAGDRVTLENPPSPADFHAAPDSSLALEVLLETDSYVVVDKQAGVPSHPLREGELGTLAGALVARYPEMRGVGYRKREPGILHRLDSGTSGLMLAARNQQTFDQLRRMLRAGEIEKKYLARCVGVVPAPMVIDTPIATDPRDRRKVRVCTDPREVKRLGAQSARTEVLSSTPAEHGSLVELRANNARRHQIRVHLASIGHPLLGDSLYGGPPLDHHLLHATSLRVGTLSITTSIWNYATSAPKIAASED